MIRIDVSSRMARVMGPRVVFTGNETVESVDSIAESFGFYVQWQKLDWDLPHGVRVEALEKLKQ